MKQILIKFILVLSLLSFWWINYVSNTYAEEKCDDKKWITVIVTEKIPWACCGDWYTNGTWATTMYKCTVQKWFKSIMLMMWKIIKYFTFLASLWGVLFIIVNGIMYSMWWAEASLKDEAKKRIAGTLVWL